MSESSWSLVIPILLAGLGLGAVWVLWLRRGRTTASPSTRDSELALADLEARQQELYAQLREAGEDERAELELAAARNLKAIEEAGGEAGSPASVPRSAGNDPAQPVPAPARAPSAWMGFLGGVACAALVGMLVVWAQRDAKPREDDTSPMMQAPAGMPGGEHPDGAQLSPRDAEALEQLARRVEDDPTDVMARKQYAVGLLSTGQFVQAFEQAEILLASNDRDPDGLYVTAMVRMRMGQESVARSHFERLLEDYPDHVPALTALGVLQLRASGLEAAEALWERALAASGGRNPEIERLVEAARQQVAAAGQTPAPAPPPAAAPPAAAGDAYTLTIDVAAGTATPPGAVLFVALRQGDMGPPAAVRRIPAPRFPMTVALTAADSMLGRPLPTDASVWARLDGDGSASTREDDEPYAETTMNLGEAASLTLE